MSNRRLLDAINKSGHKEFRNWESGWITAEKYLVRQDNPRLRGWWYAANRYAHWM